MTGGAKAQADKVAVFAPRHESSWREMEPAARLLGDAPGWTVIILVVSTKVRNLLAGEAAGTRPKGARIVDILDQVRDLETPAAVGQSAPFLRWVEDRLPASWRDRLGHGMVFGAWQGRRMVRAWRRSSRVIGDVLADLGATLVVVPGDRELGPVPAVLLAARALGLPRIIIGPIWSHQGNVLRPRLGVRRFQAGAGAPWLNRRVAARWPRLVQEYQGESILLSPGWVTLAMHWAGVLPQNPWVQGTGLGTLMVVDVPQKARDFEEQGVSPDVIRLVGKVEFDILHQRLTDRAAIRARYCARYGLDQSRPLVAFAIPLFYEMDYADRATQRDAVGRVLDAATEAGAQVLISLHPRADRSAVDDLLDRPGVAVAEDRLFEYIVAADLFVCGNSLTLQWAVMAAIPVVNFDYSLANWTIWDAMPGVLTHQDAAPVQQAIGDLLTRRDIYSDIVARQRSHPDRAIFDGRCTERLLALFEDAAVMSAAPARQ